MEKNQNDAAWWRTTQQTFLKSCQNTYNKIIKANFQFPHYVYGNLQLP